MSFTRKILIGLLGLTILFAAGCASIQGQPFAQATDLSGSEGVIYIYRPYNIIGGAKMYTILLDGKEVGKLVNGSYHALRVASGEHKVKLKEDVFLIRGHEYDASLQITAGSAKYLRFGGTWGGGVPKLIPVEESNAMPELQKCKKY